MFETFKIHTSAIIIQTGYRIKLFTLVHNILPVHSFCVFGKKSVIVKINVELLCFTKNLPNPTIRNRRDSIDSLPLPEIKRTSMRNSQISYSMCFLKLNNTFKNILMFKVTLTRINIFHVINMPKRPINLGLQFC